MPALLLIAKKSKRVTILSRAGRVYSALYTAVTVLIAVGLLGVMWLTHPGFLSINAVLALIVSWLFVLVLASLAALWLVFVLQAGGVRSPYWLLRQAWIYNSVIMPLILRVGKHAGKSRDQVMRSFVAISNGISLKALGVPADRVLLILPHCIQRSDCAIKITGEINNCARCGKCKIAALMSLADKYGIKAIVVTGGTLARKKISDARPSAVIAVACERDLTSGLMDVFPIPAVGVLNMRPNGPCFNTDVAVEEVEASLKKILGIDERTK